MTERIYFAGLILGCLLVAVCGFMVMQNPRFVTGPIGSRGIAGQPIGQTRRKFPDEFINPSNISGPDWNRKYLRLLAGHGIGLLTIPEAEKRGIINQTFNAPRAVATDRNPWPDSVIVPLDEADVPVP